MTEPRRERKVVTVLFCDLVGFTAQAESLDPEDVDAFLRDYHQRVRHELERHGGTVEKFVGDAVLALFGAPVAHEDDPERAVRAALAIRETADAELRIGITTGEALVTLGDEPTATGDVVNTASRLQAAASPGSILVDEATYRATERAIDYAAQELVEAKGKAEPIAVYEALEARSRFGVDVDHRPETLLVGRERELALLVDAFGRAREERQPQLVTLVGVPGIGKSRLVYELSRITDEDPELITWRQGRCLPYGEGVTYWAVGEMVKAEVGVLENDRADEAGEKLRRAVGELVEAPDDAIWVERHLRPLLGLGAQEGAPSDRRSETFAAWRRFFEALAERRPLVLVFEDLHWADDDLLDFVDYLADWAADVPLLCICTTRPELRERRPGWGGGKANAATVSLSPLADEEIARLLAALVERPVLPAEQQTLVLAHAGGNPLYAEQYARVLVERGDLDESALPETVHGMIAARLDGLAVEEKALLQDAAVLGKVFWLGALVDMDGEERVALEERLHALERKEFVRRERRASIAGEREYAFRHLLVRDVAYGQIPRAARAEKHRRVAEWLESVAPDRSEDQAEMLAHHYLATLELSRAARVAIDDLVEPARAALSEAGDRALALSALEPARRYYAAAVELTPSDHPDRPYVLLRWARSMAGVIRDETVAALREAIPALLAAGDVQSVAEAEAAVANALWVRGDRAAADEHAARAVELIAGAPPSDTTLSVLAERSRLLMVAGEADEAVRVAREGLAAAEELGRDHFRAQLLVNIGTSRILMGDVQGMADIEEGLAVANTVKMPPTIHRGYVNLAETHVRHGRMADAFRMFAAARESNERYGHESGLFWLLGEEADLLYLAGDWEAALTKSEKLLELAGRGTGHYHEPSCRTVIAKIRLARDDVDGAVAEIERALELAERRRDPQLLSPVLAGRAQILVAAEAAGAERAVDEALAVPVEFRAAVPLTWALVDLGRGDEVRTSLAGIGAPVWSEIATAIADGGFVRAADGLAEIGALAEEAYARLRAGSEGQVRRALDFYRSVGATRYLREGEALLAATA
jgi:class 3 adenylate cyclase/tetratricopeptide (TPR) repeat protein